MHHADALSRHVNLVEGELPLSKERIREELEKDAQCQEYKQYDDFWLDEENTLYHQKVKRATPGSDPKGISSDSPRMLS
jgi:hypothetical protein